MLISSMLLLMVVVMVVTMMIVQLTVHNFLPMLVFAHPILVRNECPSYEHDW
jgi:hypothetical protein